MDMVMEEKRLNDLKKVPFHFPSITADRIDAIIHSLMKLRKEVLRGLGIKDAREDALCV